MVSGKKRIPNALLALLLSVAVVGCGGTTGTTSASYDTYEGGEAAQKVDADGPTEESADAAGVAAQLAAPDKMVYTADITLSTREFDKATGELDARLSAAGAVTFGDNMWQDDWSNGTRRTRQLTVRVAAEGLKDLVRSLGEIEGVKVTSSNVHASDRTKEYNDSESRIELLKQEYDFYEQTVRETTDPETRLVYTDRMFELLDEIKSLENTKSQIDQDVAYSVLNVTLSEDLGPASHDGSAGVWQEIQDSFVMIPSNIGAAFGYLLLFLINILPFLVVVGLIALVVVLVVRRRRARRPKGDLPREPATEGGQPTDGTPEDQARDDATKGDVPTRPQA